MGKYKFKNVRHANSIMIRFIQEERKGNDGNITSDLYREAVKYVIQHKHEDPVIEAALDQTFGALFDELVNTE
ncbi:hypothetical protein [Desulfonema magnum]|uniref:Phage protein n=1 Tax=Desulfonema magnum TaxID=45655 RepID=A0A975GSJ9_9BACT|nr:hypothetical protein [Desulfonema magnum]QTA92114.1 Uncharacterized protein dnm_081890 [Desulfonema magnum]